MKAMRLGFFTTLLVFASGSAEPAFGAIPGAGQMSFCDRATMGSRRWDESVSMPGESTLAIRLWFSKEPGSPELRMKVDSAKPSGPGQFPVAVGSASGLTYLCQAAGFAGARPHSERSLDATAAQAAQAQFPNGRTLNDWRAAYRAVAVAQDQAIEVVPLRSDEALQAGNLLESVVCEGNIDAGEEQRLLTFGKVLQVANVPFPKAEIVLVESPLCDRIHQTLTSMLCYYDPGLPGSGMWH